MKSDKYFLVYDTESDGFWENCTTLWTFCAKDMRTGKRWAFGGPEGCQPYRKDIQELFLNADHIICHNQIKHDLPVMDKLGIVNKKHWQHAKVIDTFTLSSLLNPDRPAPPGCRGGHSLQAFGVLAKGDVAEKVEQETWDVYDPNMLVRCAGDVDLTEYTYRYLMAEIKEDGWDWKQSFDLETKVAFIIAKQERNGWQFDVEKAKQLVQWIDSEIVKVDEKLVPMLPPVIIPEAKARKFPTKKFTVKGDPAAQALKYWAEELEGMTDLQQIREFLQAQDKPKQFVEPRNPGSQSQMKEYLLTVGWKPTQFTDKGSPKLTEDSLDSIQGEAGNLFAHRCILTARRSLLLNDGDDSKGLINKVRPDGRISAVANPMATPTARMKHKNVVNIPASRSVLGKEVRSLFTTKREEGIPVWTFDHHGEIITVDDGRWALVGCDAAGLELRNLASRMNDKEYIEKVANGKKEDGTDVHTFNQRILSEFIDSRDEAKNILYAFMYGAGDEKLGTMCVRGPKDFTKRGKLVRETFLKNIPALDDLIGRVKKVSKRGHLKGLDGRKIWVRNEHAALNSLLQCDGALVMKVALVELQKNVAKERILANFVGNIHDEIQAEVFPTQAVRFGDLARQSIKDAGIILGMNCPLEGESNIGLDWSMTH